LRKFRKDYLTPNHPVRLKQKGEESFRSYYRRFGELRAQVHDVTEREVIESFSNGILAKYQFRDFCKENPRINKEFKRAVKKTIATEERKKERYPDQDNQDNLTRRNNQNNGHNKKHGPDNMVAMADKNKKFFKPKKFEKFEELENMPCIWHPGSWHTTGECHFFLK
jgi:hypothetical protein